MICYADRLGVSNSAHSCRRAWRRRLARATLAVLLLALPPSTWAAGDPAGSRPAASGSAMSSAFDDLVALMRSEEWTAADWAQATYLAMQLSRFGSPGVPNMRGRFARATTREEAFLAGVYLGTYGQATDHRFVRGELETNKRKRGWLQEMMGDRNAINASLREGGQWTAAIRLIPSLGGCRSLCLLCAQSEDALVRRAGLYWGYWIVDGAYWQSARKCAAGDPDPLTRLLAQSLLRQQKTAR